MESDPPRARESLRTVAAARAATADRLVTPPWYHPVLGLLVAQHVIAQGLDDRNWTLPSALLLLLGAFGLVMASRRMTGVLVAGPQGPRSRRQLRLLALVAAGCILVAAVADADWIPWVAATVALAGTIVLGRSYDAALRADVRDTAATLA